jgi:hypothetical protein
MRYPAGFISAFYSPLKNPDAPTIGTATVGVSSVSVTFTAPSNVGGSAITGYTVFSTPSNITGTGTSSPITVSGLAGGTAYTFKVLATNSYGSSVLSAASNSVTTLPTLGQALGGGFYAGQISTAGNGIADYNLVVGPVASAQNASVQFKTSNTTDAGAVSAITGPANSASMNDSAHPAAFFCEGLSIGGFTDWYLPARNELDVCYFGLKPTTAANATNSGINANAVPARASNYTSLGAPTQTSATNFQTGGSEAFTAGSNGSYWSSTQIQYNKARSVFFANGYQNYKISEIQKANKYITFLVLIDWFVDQVLFIVVVIFCRVLMKI